MTPGEKLLSQLKDLSVNLWWAWNPHIIKLFRDLDPDGFRAANHNPVSVLAGFSVDRLEDLSRDAGLRARVDSAHRELREYLGATRTWASVNAGPLRVRPVAYFSAEFGIHESLPIYSGGLGVLAGDHLKSASDPALPRLAGGRPPKSPPRPAHPAGGGGPLLPRVVLPPAHRSQRPPARRVRAPPRR